MRPILAWMMLVAAVAAMACGGASGVSGAEPEPRPVVKVDPAPAETAPADTTEAEPEDAPPGAAVEPPVALALVIDRSGSMNGEKIDETRKACLRAVDELEPDDFITLVAFDSQATAHVPLTERGDGDAIKAQIGRLRVGGGTEYADALVTVRAELAKAPKATKRILFFSDGLAPQRGVLEAVRDLRADGVLLSTVAFGQDFDPQLLENMAREGGGRFNVTAQLDTLGTVFDAEVKHLLAVPHSAD